MVSAVGVCLGHLITVHTRNNMVLIVSSLSDMWDESFPDARCFSWLQGVLRLIPAVEISENRNLPRIGGPDGEMSPRDTINGQKMGTELAMQVKMCPLIKQEQIVVG